MEQYNGHGFKVKACLLTNHGSPSKSRLVTASSSTIRFHHFDKTHIVPKDAEDLLDNKLGEGEGFVVCDIWRPTRVIQCSVRSSKSKEFSKTMDITSS
ncbi:unnamed protein product [Prunus armeniaca]